MRVGIVGRQGSPLQPPDISVIQAARIDALKTSYLEMSVPVPFIVVQPKTGENFGRVVKEAYLSGIRWFLIHKYPNLASCGWMEHWTNGLEFGAWWISIRNQLLELGYEEAKFGMPAMKPGCDAGLLRADAETFFQELTDTVEIADFYELEITWKTPEEMRIGLWRIDSYMHHYPRKPLIVTFANIGTAVKKSKKAEEYLDFYRELSDRPLIEAAFAFCISSPKQEDKFTTWRGEGGKEVRSAVLRRVIGKRDF